MSNILGLAPGGASGGSGGSVFATAADVRRLRAPSPAVLVVSDQAAVFCWDPTAAPSRDTGATNTPVIAIPTRAAGAYIRQGLTDPSSLFAVPWTGGAPADYNIVTTLGLPSRQLIVGAPTGALVVTPVIGANVTIPQAVLLACPILNIRATALVATGSSAANVMILT